MLHSLSRGRSRLLLLVALCCAGLAALLTFARVADAYFGSATCYNYYSAQTCWIGDGYHSLSSVYTGVFGGRDQVCAKAQTAAGNIRTGSGCSINYDRRLSSLAGSSPLSTGYGYWAGNGSPINVFVMGCTPENDTNCVH